MEDPEVKDAVRRSFLGKLRPGLVERLLAEGERIDYPEGVILYQGGSSARPGLVIHGLLRVYMSSGEGRQVTVRYARSSDVLGIPFMVGGPQNVSIQTLAQSSLVSIDAGTLMQEAQHDAKVAWAIAEELNRRLDDTLQQTAINAFGTVKQRVAAHLLDLASSQQGPQARLVAHVSQQELADAIGSVREVVARVLREFRLGGLVATSPNSVHILDAKRLHDESRS